jgi:peptidoglycan/LPS O-acetylase OafA/YrhL
MGELGDQPRKTALDGLRGAAAVLVLCAHLGLLPNFPSPTGYGPVGGQLGVWIFFVLSGYLLGHIYLNRACDGLNVRHYLIRRGGRILPLYYVAVTFGLIMQANGDLLFGGTILSALYHYLCLRGSGVLWTVAIEVQFYLLFVALWWISTKSRAVLYTILSLVIVIPFLMPLAPARLIYMPFFAVGVLISQAPLLARSQWAWAALFLGFAIATLVIIFPIANAIGAPARLEMSIYLAVVGGLLLASVQSDLARWLLGNPIASYIGKISFSIYLVHVPVIVLLRNYTSLSQLENPALFAMSAAAITLVLSALSYRYIERPGQTLAAWLAGSGRGGWVPSAGPAHEIFAISLGRRPEHPPHSRQKT